MGRFVHDFIVGAPRADMRRHRRAGGVAGRMAWRGEIQRAGWSVELPEPAVAGEPLSR
jgi:hypothetical protein